MGGMKVNFMVRQTTLYFDVGEGTLVVIRNPPCKKSSVRACLVDVLICRDPEVVGAFAPLAERLERRVRAVKRCCMRAPALVARECIPAASTLSAQCRSSGTIARKTSKGILCA